jgi:hypothetical protein
MNADSRKIFFEFVLDYFTFWLRHKINSKRRIAEGVNFDKSYV